jgi:hypothetical protein
LAKALKSNHQSRSNLDVADIQIFELGESGQEFREADSGSKIARVVREFVRFEQLRVLLFCLFLGAFCIGTIINCTVNPEVISSMEKRRCAPFPHLECNAQSIKAFPSGFESFYNDAFALRLQLVSLANQLLWRLFDLSGSDKVMIGKHGWMYYVDNGYEEILRHEQLSPSQVELFVRHFEARRLWLAAHHIKYLLVIAPSKTEIYREELPDEVKPQHPSSMLNQVVAALQERSGVEVIDLKGKLLSVKSKLELPIYYKTDSHWNALGAFVGYQDLAKHLERIFPAIKPLAWKDVEISVLEEPGGDLSGMLGMRDEIIEHAVQVKCKEQPWILSKSPPSPELSPSNQRFHPFATEIERANLPTAYVLRDSFTIALQPFISQHFRRAFFHWNYFRQPNNEFLAEEILREHPDIVIQEMAECFFAREVIPDPPEVEAMLHQ